MAEQLQHTSAKDDQQLVVLNRTRGYNLWRELKDSRIWHHLIFCEELENDDLQNRAFCWLCEKPVLRGTPAYKCLECYVLQHKSCVDQPHGIAIERHHRDRLWSRHHLIFIEEDLQDNGGEEETFICSGCMEPTTIGRDPAYKCSIPGCNFLLHKSCGELPTLIKHHPMHDPDPDPDPDPYPDTDPDHILLLREPSTEHNDCSLCRKDCRGSLFYICNGKCKGCRFYLHAACAFLWMVNPDDCHQHKLIPSWKVVQFTCQSCGEETKDFACLCSECRVLIHRKCAQFQHTIKTKTHDHSLIRTYSSLSHQLDVFCKLCYKKLNTEHAAYYCCRECGYVLHLDCAKKVRDLRPPNEWMPINSVGYLNHLVHLVEGINLAYDEGVSLPEILHFSHPQHKLILSNEEPIDDMRCEACMQFIISRAPFYGCTQCKFFLHDRCARLPETIKRGIFHEHSLTLLSQAQNENGLFECTACKRHRHGFVYNCGNCEYHLDVQCCLIPETLKHEGHQHSLFLAIGSSETCNACGKDCQDQDVRFVSTDDNFALCIRCATLPLVAKYQYETDLLKLSYTREDDSEEYYCVICEEERNHPDDWFYYCVKSKFTAHSQCLLGDNSCIKFGSTFISQFDHKHPPTFVQTHLVHLVEGINLPYDERVSLPEIQHFSHPQHNLILSNEEPIHDDMRCEACMQFLISSAPFYRCSRCKFFLHDRCARLPQTIQREIFHHHSLTLLSKAQNDNGLFECTACKRHRHGFVYNCSECPRYNLDVQCCLIPETLKHEGHKHNLFLARRSFENCNACGKDCQDQDVRLVCTYCNFILCIRCATLPLVAKYQYEADLLKLSYTREDDSEKYYCVICEEERNHPDDWFYYGVKSKLTAHTQCVIGDNPFIKFESTFRIRRHKHPLTFIQKTHHSPPCDCCYKPFYGVALKCTECKFNIHAPISKNGHGCLLRWVIHKD